MDASNSETRKFLGHHRYFQNGNWNHINENSTVSNLRSGNDLVEVIEHKVLAVHFSHTITVENNVSFWGKSAVERTPSGKYDSCLAGNLLNNGRN